MNAIKCTDLQCLIILFNNNKSDNIFILFFLKWESQGEVEFSAGQASKIHKQFCSLLSHLESSLGVMTFIT